MPSHSHRSRSVEDNRPKVSNNVAQAASLRLQGNTFFKEGQFDRAVCLYNEAIKYDRNNSTLYSNLAQAHLRQGCFAEAEKQASKAIELDGDSVKGYYRAARAAESLGEIEKAKKYLYDGMNKGRINDCDELLEFYSQLSGCKVPAIIDVKIFEQPTSKKAKKKLRMTRTEADDQFLKTLERLRVENPTEFSRAQLSIRRKKVDLNVSMRDGSFHLIKKELPKTAAHYYKSALEIIADVQPEELLEISLMEKLVLKYAISVCWSKENPSHLDLTKSVQYLNEIRASVDDAIFPAVLYPLSSIYIRINRFPQALELLEKGLNIIASGKIFAKFNWPNSDVLINETTPEGLEAALTKLKPDCTGYHKPDAVCKNLEENCERLNTQILPSRLIFYSDPDFNGFMVIHCQSKCLIEYHLPCWKDLKESYSVSIFGVKLSDKDMLGKPCPTDGCLTAAGDRSVIVQIQWMTHNREVKFHCQREPAPVFKEPKQQPKKKDTIKASALDKEKPKPRARPKVPPPEPANSKRPAGKPRVSGMDHGELDGSGDEDGHADRERLLEEFRAMRLKNFSYAADKCWQLNKPMFGRTDLPPDRWFRTKDATTTKEFIASFFYELLSNRDPMSIEELLDSWELAIDDYPEFREITLKPGFPGILKYLVESYRFVLINDFITIAEKVPELESVQLEETIECLTFFLAETASLSINYAPEPTGCNNASGDGTHVGDGFLAAREFFGQDKLSPVRPKSSSVASSDHGATKSTPAAPATPATPATPAASATPGTPVKVKPEQTKPNVKSVVDTGKTETEPVNFNLKKSDDRKEDNSLDSFAKSEIEMKNCADQAALSMKKAAEQKREAKKIEAEMAKTAEEKKVAKPAAEVKKVKTKVKVDDKKASVEVKAPPTPVKKKTVAVVKPAATELVSLKVEHKEVQTEVAGDHMEVMEIRMEGIVEENKLMQKRVENADEITMVLLDNRKKSQAQLEAVTLEKKEAMRERDALARERDDALGAAKKAALEVAQLKSKLGTYMKKEADQNSAHESMKRAFFLTQRELVMIRRDLCHLTFEETMKQLCIALTYPQLPPPKRDHLAKLRDQLAKLQTATNEANAGIVAIYDNVADKLDEVDDVDELPKVALTEIPPHVLSALVEVQQHYTPKPASQDPPPPPQQNNFYPHPSNPVNGPHPEVMLPSHVMIPPMSNGMLQQHGYGIRQQYPMMPHPRLYMPNFQQQFNPIQTLQGNPNHSGAPMNQRATMMGPPVSYAKPAAVKNPNIINEIFPFKNGVPQQQQGRASGTASPANMPETQRTHSNSSAESNQSVGRDKKENTHVGYVRHVEHAMRPKLESVITDLPTSSERPNTSNDRLIAMLLAKFPNSSDQDLLECVDEIRSKNNGLLQGFKVETIVNLTANILKRKASKSLKPAWAPVDKSMEVLWTNKNNDDCVICMDPIAPTELVELHCKHQFHEECARKWLEVDSVCPICMRFTKMVSDYPPLK